MSYEKQRTVGDGQEVVLADDPYNRDPTQGTLLAGTDYSTATAPHSVPLCSSKEGALHVESIEIQDILEQILKEMKKQTILLQMITDTEITDIDLGDLE